jgi:hypothetical protein
MGTSRLSLYPAPIPQLRVNRTDLSSAGGVHPIKWTQVRPPD